MKALFRALGFVAFLMAFVLLVVDATTVISARSLSFTSTGEFIQRLTSPGALERWGSAVSRGVHPVLWSVIQNILLATPAVVVSAIVGLILTIAGRRVDPDSAFRLRD